MNAKMLSVVWPNGIPTQDYEKLIDLVKATPVGQGKVGRPKKSDGVRGRVAALLATGPATITDLASATGYTRSAIWTALKAVAVTVGERPSPTGFAIPAKVYALKQEAK